MKLRPISDKIVVAKSKEDKTTKGGLIIPNRSSNNPTGTVIAVGSGRITSTGVVVPFEVNVGDEVLFQAANATVETYNNTDYYIMYENNILAVVE